MIIEAPDWTLKMLPELMADLKVDPYGVLHVGAHHGEEVPTYLDTGFSRVGLVEPDPDSCLFLKGQPWATDPRINIFPLACGGIRSEVTRLYQTESGVWNSLKASVSHPAVSSTLVMVMPLSYFQAKVRPNVLVVDTQGTEMDVLIGQNLSALDMIIVETQVDGLDGAHPDALCVFAEQNGWRQAVVLDRTGGWTDTVLVPRR